MSDPMRSTQHSKRDEGMTLIELIISMSILGLLAAVLSASIIVTLRQTDNTEGRLNVARSEQTVSMWIPADLASADTVDTSPQASPCGAPTCGGMDLSGGSNVLMLTWSVEVPVSPGDPQQYVTTNVSYHFAPSGDGTTFDLIRVECTTSDGGASYSCNALVVLHDLPGPLDGTPFVPGVAQGDACAPTGPVVCSRPTWVITVSQPLAANATDESQTATGSEVKDANRVIVTINGGGDSAGAGGGINQISITAGGTSRTQIAADSLLGTPSFVEARSRCGGPMALVVDESSSIYRVDGAPAKVRTAITSFVETLAGTPVKLQVIPFAGEASVLAPGDPWHYYYDMTDPDAVDDLLDEIAPMTFNRGSTNWEDALFRTFYQANADIADVLPETVVFFTDGVPTMDRLFDRDTDGVIPAEPAAYSSPPWDNASGSRYNQASFNRAAFIAKDFRQTVRLIGVGVGGINENNTWVSSPGAGYVNQWQRASARYQHVTSSYQSNIDRYHEATSFESRLDFEERRNGNSWRNIDPDEYFANTTNGQENSNYRINGTRNSWSSVSANNYRDYRHISPSYFRVDNWSTRTEAQYYANYSSNPWKWGFSTTSWYTVTEAAYNQRNSTTDESDGWRINTVTTWVPESTYQANNTTPDATDGWVDTGADQWVTPDSAAIVWKDVPTPSPVPSTNSSSDGYRMIQTYPATPPAGGYSGYGSAATEQRTGAEILAELISGNKTGTPALPLNGPWAHPELADMFVLGNNSDGWSRLDDALKAIALGECGGTLTIQTKVGGTAPAADPFKYQNSKAWNAAGDVITMEPTVVTTNQQYTAGTFDFAIPSGQYIKIEVRPQNYEELSAYTPGSWSCKAGVTPITDIETFPIDDAPGWTGVRVNVAANQAVSCVLSVSRS